MSTPIPIELGASPDAITAAAAKLGVEFPDKLTAIWLVSNGLELSGGWGFFPVFDVRKPRESCNDIVYENTKGHWEYMPQSLLAIAAGDTGNRLVLTKTNGTLSTQVLHWHHETNKTKPWKKDLDYILEQAHKRIAEIEKQIQRSRRRKMTSNE